MLSREDGSRNWLGYEDNEFIFSPVGLERMTNHLSGNLYLATADKEIDFGDENRIVDIDRKLEERPQNKLVFEREFM